MRNKALRQQLQFPALSHLLVKLVLCSHTASAPRMGRSAQLLCLERGLCVDGYREVSQVGKPPMQRTCLIMISGSPCAGIAVTPMFVPGSHTLQIQPFVFLNLLLLYLYHVPGRM